MNRLRVLLFSVLLLFALANSLRADVFAPTGRVIKVLPLFLDQTNQVAPSPSLYDRDAYQAWLLAHTNQISGIRFDVNWKAHHASGLDLKLRLELRGIGARGLPTVKVMEESVAPKVFNHWSSLTLNGVAYKNFGVLAAWRATLWNGGQLLDEEQSFLWSSP
jgi:hypothetical protein